MFLLNLVQLVYDAVEEITPFLLWHIEITLVSDGSTAVVHQGDSDGEALLAKGRHKIQAKPTLRCGEVAPRESVKSKV
jgi:hypothetical protein